MPWRDDTARTGNRSSKDVIIRCSTEYVKIANVREQRATSNAGTSARAGSQRAPRSDHVLVNSRELLRFRELVSHHLSSRFTSSEPCILHLFDGVLGVLERPALDLAPYQQSFTILSLEPCIARHAYSAEPTADNAQFRKQLRADPRLHNRTPQYHSFPGADLFSECLHPRYERPSRQRPTTLLFLKARRVCSDPLRLKCRPFEFVHMEYQAGVRLCDCELPQQLRRRVVGGCDLGHDHSSHKHTVLVPKPQDAVLGHKANEEARQNIYLEEPQRVE